ncbi:MAG: MBL fold metallo-hydrolase, partial [Firmicutes bacterium]|nr:MBL fold metallo-hydrolase [Bacillota bacterium]
MKIKRFVGGSLESNGYIISNKAGGSCYIIDPGYEPKKFIDYVEAEGLSLKGIILTHHHHDHVGGVARIRDHFGVPAMMHEMDAPMYKGTIDRQLRDGDTIDLDGETLL